MRHLRRQRLHRSLIMDRERETYEYTTTTVDPQQSSIPSRLTTQLPAHLLTLFFEHIPQELRDIIYDYTVPFNVTFIIQGSLLFAASENDMRKNLAPFSPFPSPEHMLSSSSYYQRLVDDLAMRFFARNKFWNRYRYTPALQSFLTTPFAPSTCIPAEYMLKVELLLGPPDSAEDSLRLDDEEYEYEWSALMPVPKNEKCAMWRTQLESDFVALSEVLQRQVQLSGRKKRWVRTELLEVCDRDYLSKGCVVDWYGDWALELGKKETVRARTIGIDLRRLKHDAEIGH